LNEDRKKLYDQKSVEAMLSVIRQSQQMWTTPSGKAAQGEMYRDVSTVDGLLQANARR